MPTGVTVSHDSRIFMTFPRWDDPVAYSVGELLPNGKTRAYPSAAWHDQKRPLAQKLVSVQSAVVDPRDRLWLVDTGSINMGPVTYGGPKLVGVDLQTNKVIANIVIPAEVIHPLSYLNDVRFDLRRGQGGLAYLTDSSAMGPNGIVVVELGTGRAWRRLNDHPSTKAEPSFTPFVEGRPLVVDKPGQPPMHLSNGSDGIAMGAGGVRLFYTPLASRHLFSASVDALSDPAVSDADVAATVIDHGDKGSGSDGLESDTEGGVFLTAYEQNAIIRRSADGSLATVVHDPRLLWPDTMSLTGGGWLYVTANQLHRGPGYHNGHDERQKPYSLFKVRVTQKPVRLL